MTQLVYGHDEVFERFRRAVAQGRLASTFLFVGPAGIGKRLFAERLTAALLCESNAPNQLDQCGHCESCKLLEAGNHPDFVTIERNQGAATLSIDQFIGAPDKRGREGLCHDISLKAMRGGRKIGIIDDADYLIREAANCLLKTLEEPPPRSVLILIGTSLQRQISTIRSRCQIVRFQPLPDETVAQILLEKNLVQSPEQAAEWATRSAGSVAQAILNADENLLEFRQWFLEILSKGELLAAPLATEINKFIKASGGGSDDDDGDSGEPSAASARKTTAKKKAPKQDATEVPKVKLTTRDRVRFVVNIAIEFHHELLLKLTGTTTACHDQLMQRAVARRAGNWSSSIDQVLAVLNRCLVARKQVDSNANMATLLEAWLDDTQQLEWQRGG